MAAVSLGCGGELYERRLGETVSYFEYKDQISRELGRVWNDRGVSLQPPRQFSLIPPPAVAEAPEGQAAFIDPSQDPRQPHYLGIELPGLIGAWDADVSVDAGGNQKAYLYVLSNYDRHLQLQSGEGADGDPQSLIADVESSISRAIGVYLPDGTGGSGQKKNQRYQETIPRGLPHSKYQPQQQFTAITFSPEVQPTDVPVEMQIYEWEGQKMQAAVLMVYPAAVSPREDLHNRLLLAMETFRASDQVPRSAGAGATSPADGGRRGAAF
ncbi:MAG: hypothetical protein AB7U20_14810 [Planctomycetaceae bacterium]